MTVLDDPTPYNPLDRRELAKSVERALFDQPLRELPPQRPFGGAGLYALYYLGAFPAYAPIAPQAQAVGQVPIYVGRARPDGSRQGVVATTRRPALFTRLCQHAKSIQAVEDHAARTAAAGLALADFRCRYLVADDIWVPLGEALLLARYRPVWNSVLDGFGNHDPGRGRRQQRRSSWDVLHPGRGWASTLAAPSSTATDLSTRVAEHLAVVGRPVPDGALVLDLLVDDAGSADTG